MNRLGIEMLTLLGMPPVDHVRLAGELGCVSISTGLSGLPLSIFGLDDIFYPTWSLRDDPALRREMKSAMRDSGVHIGLGEGFRARPDGDVSAQAADLDMMADLSARRINAIGTDPDVARSHDQLAKLAEMVIAREMIFTVEFAPLNALDTLKSALAVVDHVGRGRCAVLIDSMHFFRTGSTVADLEALDPDQIGYVQLCDAPMVSKGGTYMEEAMFARMTPGEGEFPLREFIAALPADVEIGLEVPQLDTLRAGISPHDHAKRVVAAARALGA